LKKIDSVDYVTSDLSDRQVDVHTDMTNLVFPECSFDLILASHVLEHVVDDALAMRELLRVLRPGGVVCIQVPYDSNHPTDEDPMVTDPRERTKRFGQADHVRLYGTDLPDRLRKAGFTVQETRTARSATDAERTSYGLWDDILFVCTRPNLSDGVCASGLRLGATLPVK
jgi:predicted SAM-dependent methyltransferase